MFFIEALFLLLVILQKRKEIKTSGLTTEPHCPEAFF